MGFLLKEWKKRLTKGIKKRLNRLDSVAALAAYKPANTSVEDWDAFVDSRLTTEFAVISKFNFDSVCNLHFNYYVYIYVLISVLIYFQTGEERASSESLQEEQIPAHFGPRGHGDLGS
jgi:hypothetical protein